MTELAPSSIVSLLLMEIFRLQVLPFCNELLKNLTYPDSFISRCFKSRILTSQLVSVTVIFAD